MRRARCWCRWRGFWFGHHANDCPVERARILDEFRNGVGSKTLPLSYRYPHGVLTEQEGGAPNDALNWDTADHVCRRHRVVEHICRDRETRR